MSLSPQSTAFIFPGQGSQFVGMGKELAEKFLVARQVFEQADTLLGFPLSQLAWNGPEETLNDTINTQPALLTHSVAALFVFQSLYPDFSPAHVAGHSMGELTALVASGSLAFPQALLLVRRRGELMKSAGEASPGGMAAILGLDIPTAEQVCASASTPAEIVQVANDNCPGQVVISGNREAMDRAVLLAREAGARHAKPLAISIAAHSPLMTQAQADFNQAVQSAPIEDPKRPIVGNVSAAPLRTATEIRADLQAQLTSRVRWTESIQGLTQQGITTFVELGSGTVLTGLLKRIHREAAGINLGTPADFDKLVLDAV